MIEVTVFLCKDCLIKTGYGKPVEIVYSNTGGWSSEWEGRHCVHLTAQEILRSNK